MASVSGSSTGLPTSLHSVYQRYKAGTAVSTDWLVKTGAPQLTTTTDRLPVQRVLELAQAAAKRKISPPKTLRTTFKIVLAHRRTLTRYHQDHHAGSETVKKSTDSREFFNEILAQAYDTLFPAGADAFTKKSPRHIDAQQMDIPSESSNRFVTLSEMIEHEPDSDPAYVAPSVETAKPDARSQIEDDPLEEIIAMYTYILEVECAINLVNKTWIMARNGQLPLTVAGTLTNFAYGQIRLLSSAYGPSFGMHPGLCVFYYRVKHLVPQSAEVQDPLLRDEDLCTGEARIFRDFSKNAYFDWAPMSIDGLLDAEKELDMA
jgi:hypothetical protein